ncbi:DUF3999 domain-containing protein [Tahibacter harae]|uniref:DUF3999 domain-containing protein n=1 Tax=Tahibacter harae TaxID=2963937 RepID=A0ABT1QQM6_9GAMM|nr:DUF3999 domain-containing protein [Tahibacter harae]MCQ4164567.1 DUF3999 domain-containing protein [Tahibacter harae]
MKTCRALALLLLAGAAQAGQRDDYAREWPLRLAREDGGAFRVVLSEEIYRSAQHPALADIEVFNAAGESLPVALLGPEAAGAQEWPRQTVPLPWFPLPPAGTGAETADWSVQAERNAQGRIVRVDTRIGDSTGAAPAAPREFLVDLSQNSTPLQALLLEWPADSAPFQSQVVLYGSDDLQHWNRLSDGLLAELRNAGEQLRRNRLELRPEAHFRYLRLSAAATAPLPPLRGIAAESAPPPPEPEWRWLSLQGKEQRDGAQIHYDYRLEARIPVQQLDVLANTSNSAVDWLVHSREQEDLSWNRRAGPWTGYRVAAASSVEASAPQRLGAATRDRLWRVDAAQRVNAVPTLSLGYRPEVLVFLAQGQGPYAVAAGSRRAQRQDAPLATLLDALRRHHGPDWKPYPAVPGPGRVLSGERALATPPAPPRPPVEWTSVLLWVLLVGGAAFIAGIALRLLNAPER